MVSCGCGSFRKYPPSSRVRAVSLLQPEGRRNLPRESLNASDRAAWNGGAAGQPPARPLAARTANPWALSPSKLQYPVRGVHVIMQWISDFRHGWRALVRTPGFLVTSVVTLALAIGAVVGMFNVVNTVLLRPLPFPDSDRLVVVRAPRRGRTSPSVSASARSSTCTTRSARSSSTASSCSARGRRRCVRRTASSGSRWRCPPTTSTPRSACGRSSGGSRSRTTTTRRGHQRPALEHLVRPRSRGDRQVVLRLRRDAPGHRRHAAGVQLPERRDAALGRRTSQAGRGSPRAARARP